MNESLAIVGMGCRFPGGANSLRSFWDLLCAGTDAIREIPADRWSIAAHYDPTPGRVAKSISKWGGFIDDIDRFDSRFFGISAREADGMDPQQRLLLEATWEALEDGGQTLEAMHGSRTGVFVGISTADYAALQFDSSGRNVADVYSATGSTSSIAANRISYCFDLRGPSLAVDTACSSALTACHVASQSLWRGDCSMAVVAGVNALLNPNNFIAFSRMSMLSPDGRCKAFDSRANGFVRAEGVGAVILKPLSAAQADGDRIYAVIRSTAANQDGRTNGITVPNRDAQQSLILEACRAAQISPGSISYVEAHGTGTPIGDPIETAALGAALAEGRRLPCPIGSVKTNIGHLEAASGIASLIKVALVLKHKTIPPSIHLKTPNPNIDFEKLNLRVVREIEAFPSNSGPLLAGINSFGFGGANAHVILEAAPALHANHIPLAQSGTVRPLILPISAHTGEALRQAAQNYRALLQNSDTDSSALCAAAATRRSHLAHRLCLIADSREQLMERLDDFLGGQANPSVIAGEVSQTAAPAFVFSGQGPQWWAMGRELMRDEPVFRRKIEECDALLREFGPWSLMEELMRDEKSSRMQQTEIAQPAIFAIQAALADVWQSWGVHPAAVVGHSVGEAAAAHVAGTLSLREAVRVIFHRGRSMDAAPSYGRMLAATLDAKEAEEIAASFPGKVAVAAFNSPVSVTFSGEPAPLEEIARTLESRGIFNRFLQVNYAFHSHLMDPARRDLLEALGKVETSAARLALYSTVTGTATDGRDLDADYWWRNVRQPVRFYAAIDELVAQGHRLFLELSAHPVLTGSIREVFAHRAVQGEVVFSLRRKQPEMESMLQNLGALHAVGSPVGWKSIYLASDPGTPLPAFPWQHDHHWRESAQMRTARLDSPIHPFLTVRVPAAEQVWNTWLDLSEYSWLRDHRVHDHIVFPGAGYVETALAIGAAHFKSLPLEVEDIEFQKARVLPEGKDPVLMQSAFSPADAMVRFSSLVNQVTREWSLHAAAKLRRCAQSNPPAIDLKKLQAAFATKIEKPEVYAACAKRGFHYGPMFQAVQSVWKSENGSSEAFGKIVLPDELAASASRFQIHPSVLDACLQVALFAAPGSADRTTFLPTRIDQLIFFSSPGKTVFCHAKLVQASSKTLVWNFQLAGESGRVLLEAEGFRAQAVRQASAPRSDDPDNWLYETKWIEKPLAAAASSPEQQILGTWLIFADRSGIATRLAADLRRQGATPLLLRNDFAEFSGATEASSAESLSARLHQILAEAGNKLAGVIHLWSIDAPASLTLTREALAQAEAISCHSLLLLVQSLSAALAAPPLWLVTRGAQCVSAGDGISVAQSPLLGMGRTLLNEFPRTFCRMIDLDQTNASSAARILLQEIVSRGAETEVAWRSKTRLASRIARTALESFSLRTPQPSNPSYQLRIPSTGVMDELALHASPRRKPGPHEVEIEIHAAALNFRDVMKLLGIYPLESDRDTLLGDECSGRIVAVGSKIKHFSIGDQVIANGAGCFASHLTVPAQFVARKPARLTFEEAATLPVAFMTARYALHDLGRIKRGERVLIHAATGGVGLAAIQIAQLAGAEIFATAGSEEKRRYLRKLGIRPVMDSRSTAFAAEIRKLTKGAGVDLVLNSLAGDAIEKSISVLAPGGRFLEIGKRDVYANSPIGLRPFRNNLSLFVIDMGQVMAGQPETVQSLLQTILKLVRQGKLNPLPHRTFPITNATDAFRLMAQAKHIGKIVLSTQGVSVSPRPAPDTTPIAFPSNASYLITGGLGGFGLSVAQWLVENGARHLLLTGRTGAASPEAKRSVAALRRLGAKVIVVKADVANESDVTRLFDRAKRELPPVRGIFHAATVLDDALLQQLTPERFARVMAPKAIGAWNLHTASSKLKLDHFVLFSSVSALVGTAGQANYSTANCFLDALAQHRRSLALPALSINWGALSEVGILARNARVAAHLCARGVFGIAPAQATQMLGRLLKRDVAQIGFMHVDWQKLLNASPGASPSPRYSEVLLASATEAAENEGDPRSLVVSAPAAEQRAIATSFVAESVARILRTDAAKLDRGRPLKEIGLDSLMAIELINRLDAQFRVPLPTGSISSNSTIESLTALILKTLGTGIAGAEPTPIDLQSHEIPNRPTAPPEYLLKCALTLRASATGAPLIFIHPAGGATGIYDPLVAHLPQGFPIYAIQSRVLAGAADEFKSVKEMAGSYASLIADRCPEGTLRLAGFSAGGLFALATAHELELRGRHVALLAMIETPVAMLRPGYPRVRVLQNLIAELYDQLTGELPSSQKREGAGLSLSTMGLAEKMLAANDDTSRLRLAMGWMTAHGLDVGGSGDSGLQRFIQVLIRHAILIEGADFNPISAPVWMVRARASRLTRAQGAQAVRSRITNREFTQTLMNGRHFELMQPPLVEELAARISLVLQEDKANR